MKYDVYQDTYSGLYYLIPLEGTINERRILLTSAGLVRSSYRAGDVITSPAFVLVARNCVPKRSVLTVDEAREAYLKSKARLHPTTTAGKLT